MTWLAAPHRFGTDDVAACRVPGVRGWGLLDGGIRWDGSGLMRFWVCSWQAAAADVGCCAGASLVAGRAVR